MNDYIVTKRCSKCGIEYPATKEFFFAHKQKIDGLRPDCKKCNQVTCAIYRQNNPEKMKEYERKRYYLTLDYRKEYRINHRDELNAYSKEYASTHSQEAVKRSRDWAKNNPERHRILQQIAARRRYARKLKAEGTFNLNDILNILFEQSNLCAYCGIRVYDDFQIDHIIPLSRGGSNWPDNLAVSCKNCNAQKNARTPNEWQIVRGW